MNPADQNPKPLPAHTAAQRRDWPTYFDRMEGKPARQTLVRALAAFGDHLGNAIDLGAGSGRDTEEILKCGWSCTAIEPEQNGLDRLLARPACRDAGEKLHVQRATFAEAQIPEVDLVNASFALPFCPPEGFGELWHRIDSAIKPGGRFSGQFFGDRDDWAILEDRTHLTRNQTIALFDAYVLELFEEEDRPSSHAGEAHKHWHVFHVVARKHAADSESR